MREEINKSNETKLVGQLTIFFVTFAKIGAVAYGGGPSMVPILKAEVVERRDWVKTEAFIDMLALGNTLPGPIITKMAAAIGYVRGGAIGATISVLGIVVPSSVTFLILMGFVNLMKGNQIIASMLFGIRPVVVSMLAYAAWDMTPNALSRRKRMTIVIFIASLLLMIFSPIHTALIIVAGAVLGMIMEL